MLDVMTKSGLPESVRKFLRREKARIRRENFDSAGAEKKIQELVVKIFERHKKVRVTPAEGTA